MGKISKKLTRKEVLSAVKKDGDVLFSIDKSFWLDAEIVYQSTKEIYDNIDDWDAITGLLDIIKGSKVDGDKFIKGHKGLHSLVVEFLEQEYILNTEVPRDYERDLYKTLIKWAKENKSIRGTFKTDQD